MYGIKAPKAASDQPAHPHDQRHAANLWLSRFLSALLMREGIDMVCARFLAATLSVSSLALSAAAAAAAASSSWDVKKPVKDSELGPGVLAAEVGGL